MASESPARTVVERWIQDCVDSLCPAPKLAPLQWRLLLDQIEEGIKRGDKR
jgi:hypothetical protein